MFAYDFLAASHPKNCLLSPISSIFLTHSGASSSRLSPPYLDCKASSESRLIVFRFPEEQPLVGKHPTPPCTSATFDVGPKHGSHRFIALCVLDNIMSAAEHQQVIKTFLLTDSETEIPYETDPLSLFRNSEVSAGSLNSVTWYVRQCTRSQWLEGVGWRSVALRTLKLPIRHPAVTRMDRCRLIHALLRPSYSFPY